MERSSDKKSDAGMREELFVYQFGKHYFQVTVPDLLERDRYNDYRKMDQLIRKLLPG